MANLQKKKILYGLLFCYLKHKKSYPKEDSFDVILFFRAY